MIAIVDYGLGNLASVEGAVRRLGHDVVRAADAATLARADKLILPGVGAFGDGMRGLSARKLTQALGEAVLGARTPVLGICLGFQLLARESEEFGRHAGLGWIDARIVRLDPANVGARVPHVGWNVLIQTRPSLLFRGVPEDALFYYVHSFRLVPAANDIVVGECDHGGRFCAALERNNIHAVQFHPEKSQRHGLSVLANFLDHA